ncbi:MAG: hypothetical protein IPG94_12895 [Kineosporiaceae bacterium]|nr:hypothetical protein [Kineosporiaceae bacterium]
MVGLRSAVRTLAIGALAVGTLGVATPARAADGVPVPSLALALSQAAPVGGPSQPAGSGLAWSIPKTADPTQAPVTGALTSDGRAIGTMTLYQETSGRSAVVAVAGDAGASFIYQVVDTSSENGQMTFSGAAAENGTMRGSAYITLDFGRPGMIVMTTILTFPDGSQTRETLYVPNPDPPADLLGRLIDDAADEEAESGGEGGGDADTNVNVLDPNNPGASCQFSWCNPSDSSQA